MKAKEDVIYARKEADGHVIMYIDEQCTQPFVNSVVYISVCEAMKDVKPGCVEMICFENVENV